MNRDLEHTGQDTVLEPGALGFPMAFSLLVSRLNLPRAPIARAKLGLAQTCMLRYFLSDMRTDSMACQHAVSHRAGSRWS